MGITQIANRCLGSYSGVLLNLLIALAIFGILTLYMLLFARIAIQIFSSESAKTGKAVNIFGRKELYIIGLCILISPIIVKRHLSELKLSSYVLCFGLISLATLLTVKLTLEGSYENKIVEGLISPVNETDQSDDVITAEKVMDCVNISVAS